MVEGVDIPSAVIDAQFMRFMDDRTQFTVLSDLNTIPGEVFRVAKLTVALELFLDAMTKAARWN